MPKSYRRFELLLPTQFNDDRPVPTEAFADTLLELETRFGAASSERKSFKASGVTKGNFIVTN
jgi:hypothetical protein